MAFDADAFAAAHEPWTITLRGEQFTARELSADEAMVWMDRLRKAKPDEQVNVVRRIWQSLFPWKLRYVWTGDPVGRMKQLGWEAQQAALADFFGPREASQYRKARLPKAPSSA